MADANAQINIDINTSAAAAGLRQLQSQITAFNSTLTKSSAVQATALRNSTQNILELVNASRFFTAETVRMQTAAASLDKTLSKGQVTIGQFFGARFRKDSLAAAQVMSLANTRAAALQTQFIATGAAANGMRDAIAIRPLQAFNNAAVVSAQKLAIHRAMLQQATTQMINFGKNTQWAGRQLMVGFTVPLTIFAGVAGKTFRDLEREAVNFRKVYGDAFTPPEEMEKNLQAVQELAKEYTKYGIAVKDTIALAAEAAAAGAQNKDLLDATTQATRLATLGQMQQNEALETTISLQNAFKLSGDDLAQSINFLNMVENQTVVTLQDLSAAIPRVAPVIKGLGGDVADLAAFMAALQEGGVTAEQGANALKSGLASLINPTDRAKEKLDSLGISLDSIIQMNRGDLMGTVQDFATALDTLDEFTRQQALEQVFGKFQYARLGALFANINKDGTQAARVLEMTAMSAAEMAASAEKELGAIEEAVGTKFTAAMEKLQLAIAPIGEMFTKMAIPVINFFTSILDKFNNLPDFAKTFTAFASVIVGIVIPTGTMFLGLLMNLIGTLIKFGALVGTAFKGFTSGGFKGAFDAVSQSLKFMSLAELDAVNSAQQLASSAEAVNAAFLQQVSVSDGAQAAIMELAYAYEILTNQMLEAAVANDLAFGVGATAMGQAGARGPRIRRNRGGTIPGSGNTDTVPAMLTPGEFVVNKQATRDNLPLLKAINSGNIPGFSLGGAVIGAALRAAAQSVRARPLTSPLGAMPVVLPETAAKSVGNMPSYMKNTINRFIEKRLRDSGYSGEQDLRFIKDLPVGVAALDKKLNNDLRRGKGSIESLIENYQRTGNVAPLSPLFETELTRSYLSSRGIIADVAQRNIERNLIRLLQREMVRGNTEISDSRYAYLSRVAFRAAGSNVGDFYSYLLTQKGARRTSFETSVSQYIASNYPGKARGLISDALFDAGIPFQVQKGAGRKWEYFVTDPDTGQIYRIKTSATTDIVGSDLMSYQSLRMIPGTHRAHFMNKGGNVVPGSGNTDTVPAMLTPGEFVVNKESTKKNRKLLESINSGNPIKMNKGGMVPGVQYLFRGGVAQRLAQALMGPKPINNVYQQKAIESQLTNWLDMKMRKTNVRELGRLLGTRQKETELFRGIKMRPSDSGFANRFPKETQDALYRFARSGNPDDLAAIIGQPVAIAPRSFSTSRKVAQTFGGDPINVGNPQKDAAPLILKLRNEEGVFGFKPTERIGTAKQSGKFLKEKRFYSRGSQNEREIVPVGDPRLGNRRDVVVGRWAFDGKDVVIDTGAKLSRREIAKATQNLDAFTASRFTPREEIRKTQIEVQRLRVEFEKAKRNPGTTSSKQLGDLATKLMAQSDRNKILSGGTRKDKRAINSITKMSTSMLDEVAVMFNRAKALGMNKGSIVPGSGNKDTVPAMLTPGEFVVNKAATKNNLPLLHAINGGQIQFLNVGGRIEKINSGMMDRQGKPITYYSANGQLFAKRSQATKALRSTGGSGMMRGMGASMGLGMGGMGVMMLGQQMQASAAQRGETSAMGGFMSTAGIGLSMASILPMIPGLMSPVGLAVAGVAAAATAATLAIKAWRESVDGAARKAAEFGANLGGTANALNTIAELTGQQTPLQRRAQVQLGLTNKDIENIMSPEMTAILSSEKGQGLVEELKSVTSAERFQKLADYLRSAIASGLMDKSMAESFAKAVSFELNDALLSSKVVKIISGQGTGARAMMGIAEQRSSAANDLFTRLEDEFAVAAEQVSAGYTQTVRIGGDTPMQVVGVAIQGLQDYANVQALAQEELANGIITSQEFAKINEEVIKQQNRFSQALEASIKYAADSGAVMQATMDQLINAGIVTEEQFKSLEGAAKVSATQDISVAKAIEMSESLESAGIAALAMGTDIVSVNAALRDLADTATGGTNAMRVAFDALGRIDYAIAETQIMGLIGGQAPGREAATREQLRGFITGGGDTAGLQAMLGTMSPQEAASTMGILGQLGDVATQNKFISDFQNLTSTVGTEFARQITMSDEYLAQLEKGQTTLIDTLNEAANIFGEKTQDMLEYANRSGTEIQMLTKWAKDLQSIPQEATFKLGIDITSPKDLEKFGPIADSIESSWPVLSKLPEEIDLKAFVNANIKENGQLLDSEELANKVIQIKKAMADLDSTKPEIVKNASVNIMVAEGMTMTDAKTAFENIISGMEDFNNFEVQDKIFVIQAAVDLYDAIKALEALQQVNSGDLDGGIRALRIAQEQNVQRAQARVTGAEQAGRINIAGTGRGGGGGGGGTPEKTIPEILREEAKLATGFAKTFSGKRGANFLAKPFGPEFLEYLRSQGQKGLDLLKGNLKALQGAYKDFQKTQKAESLMVLQFMPGQLKEQLDARKAEVFLAKEITKQYGITSDLSVEILSTLDDTQKVELMRQMQSGKISKEYKNTLNSAIELAQYNKQNAEIMRYLAMTEEQRNDERLSIEQEILDTRRRLDETRKGGLIDLQKEVDEQQKILDGISRAIELKQRESDAISRSIELKQRELEPIDDQIDAYEEQIDKITEYYDKQLEALDEVQKRESELEQLRRGQLDVASALSRGDVAAAASAAIELRRQFAEQRREDVRSALEKRRQSEIEDIQEKINEQQEKRKAIEEEINKLQLKQRAIQDEIYTLQKSQVPIQDAIYDLQVDIRNETERLDDAYNAAGIEVDRLKSKLDELIAKQEYLNSISGGPAGGGAPGGGGGGGAPGGGGGAIGNNPFPDGPDAASKAQHRIWFADANFNAGNYAAARNYLSAALTFVQQAGNSAIRAAWNATDGRLRAVGYMYGGKVNYKGSTEPAPGFMMGGKVNKYAFGSFVPGTGMTDKVPAMLTPGEFVVRKSVAQKFGPMLEKMNSQVFPGMGIKSSAPRSFVSQSAPRVPSGSVAPRSYSSPGVSASMPSNPATRFSNAATDFAQPLSRVSSVGQKIMPSPNIRMAAPRSKSFSVPKSQPISSTTAMAATPRSSGGSSGNVSYNNPVEYNYSITVNAQSVSSADDIANTVIAKIKTAGDRQIRGVGL